LSSNDETNKPFNHALEHKQNIEGYPRYNLGKLPMPIKLIVYFMLGGVVLMTLLGFLRTFLLN